MKVVSRFAPAPTGYLHLGHVVNAIYVWGIVRAAGGRVLLRIEDHDRQRSRPHFETALIDDLEWLGFVPDEPALAAFRAGACEGRQSDRHPVYTAALDRLRDAGLVYACTCSRRDAGPAPQPGAERRYPGTCARKRLAERPGTGLRLRVSETLEAFEDLRHGAMSQRPAGQCGDLLLRDRDGHWTYQFAAAVDDLAQGVTLVVRGDDLLASTGRQMYAARCLGRTEPPLFLHHPLVMRTATEKLSKAAGDTGVRDLRDRGWRAEDVIGAAAYRAGLCEAGRPVAAGDVSSLVPDLPRITARLAGRLGAGVS